MLATYHQEGVQREAALGLVLSGIAFGGAEALDWPGAAGVIGAGCVQPVGCCGDVREKNFLPFF